jgi:hypothetical protein
MVTPGTATRLAGAKTPTMPSASGAVDHWSAILLYSMGFGAIAVGILLFAVFLIIALYGQFVWTLTQWDGVNIRLTPFKSLAYLIIVGTFAAGMCVGFWCFSGAAWKKQKSPKSPGLRRGSR